MRLPRNTATVRILRVILICSTRKTPTISLRPRPMRKIHLKSRAVRRPRLTGKTRRSVFPASGRYSVIETSLRMMMLRPDRAEARLTRLRMKTRNLKSSSASEIPASMRMMRQILTAEGAMAARDSMMTMISSTMTSILMTKMMMS